MSGNVKRRWATLFTKQMNLRQRGRPKILRHRDPNPSGACIWITGMNIYRPQRSWGKVIFSQASVISVNKGGHVCLGGVCGWGACVVGGKGVCGRGVCVTGEACVTGGCAWWGACMAGGVCGRGHAWQRGGVWQGGMHGEGGHAWQRGACMAKGGMHGKGEACMAKGGMHGKGGCAWQRGACMVKRGNAWYAHPPYEIQPVNAQAVCILLECILVSQMFTDQF